MKSFVGWKVISLVLLAYEAQGQDARFDCPATSCWCRDTYTNASVTVRKAVEWRTAFNHELQKDQVLYLDEYTPPTTAATPPRPGIVIIHGGAFNEGPYDGCSKSRDDPKFVDWAMKNAVRGYVLCGAGRRQTERKPAAVRIGFVTR